MGGKPAHQRLCMFRIESERCCRFHTGTKTRAGPGKTEEGLGMNKWILGILSAAAVTLACGAASAGTLDVVKARGSLKCGVHTGLAGFAAHNDKGEWTGFDADFCRAVAAAIFDDPTKVTFVPTN